ncbi:class I SAM-dependent methyltransferase [Piscirickettsia salmonis]|uniref:class I SAM-dependent methyltransferase n=1 Tax=Piscirickettsia salmonis TaxID=1238 RepID=UPI0007C8CE7F|nr:Malonyl-[acyl-carrier protein] O-methyltransferase [Piscirickettsiaceae bacterium NZ-RLO1]
MRTNDYTKKAKIYALSKITETGYLAYRDTLRFIPNRLKKGKTLDFGCGSGRSTQFLKESGFNVIGLDISSSMIEQAKKQDKNLDYILYDGKNFPFANESFDLIVSILVLFEISTLGQIEKIFTEVYRVLSKEGIAVFVTGSEIMYSYHWLSIFPQVNKKSFSSGELVQIKLKENLVLNDYFWTNNDYQNIFKVSGFNCIKTHHPLGLKNEYNWVSEQKQSPYVLYILKKQI